MSTTANSYATLRSRTKFLTTFRKGQINSSTPVTFGGELHLLTGDGVLQELAKTREIDPSAVRGKKLTSEVRLSFAALTSAAVQGICAFLIAMNSIKLVLGITSTVTAGGSSFIHSGPVRLILRYVSAVLATATLYVIWNGWRLRNRREAQWRGVPLSRREKWMIAFGLFSAAASWFLIIAEVYAHQRIHPR